MTGSTKEIVVAQRVSLGQNYLKSGKVRETKLFIFLFKIITFSDFRCFGSDFGAFPSFENRLGLPHTCFISC